MFSGGVVREDGFAEMEPVEILKGCLKLFKPFEWILYDGDFYKFLESVFFFFKRIFEKFSENFFFY